jgi:hypothetical protein
MPDVSFDHENLVTWAKELKISYISKVDGGHGGVSVVWVTLITFCSIFKALDTLCGQVVRWKEVTTGLQ